MPIYAYRCTECGHAKDVLQRMSDAVLTLCPACGAQAFAKQVTAAGFQLKGSGWYVTDFKGDKKPAAPAADSPAADAAKADAPKTDAPAASPAKTDGGSATPAPAPAPAPAAAAPAAAATPAAGAK